VAELLVAESLVAEFPLGSGVWVIYEKFQVGKDW
jgi:hypothetical protein